MTFFLYFNIILTKPIDTRTRIDPKTITTIAQSASFFFSSASSIVVGVTGVLAAAVVGVESSTTGVIVSPYKTPPWFAYAAATSKF